MVVRTSIIRNKTRIKIKYFYATSFSGVWQRSNPGPSYGLQEEPTNTWPSRTDLPERDRSTEGDQPRSHARGDGVRASVQKPPLELYYAETKHEEDTHEG
ncbi:unnamed protein product [Euphydryas editha]|uniref:Uncharacterized protein n=1 Tax=Euphydryas editha TaxID=104508 RepID=A0AAU9V5C9_EUPED|nr:unnamed protein product [Euphydryas editha]